ncbi:MAG: hypothetical protein KAJ05_08805, partial [Candidatus Latescibacteria bacterium]|nr:hypothetical protein [Candidatus Latescibacterota bacterium]
HHPRLVNNPGKKFLPTGRSLLIPSIIKAATLKRELPSLNSAKKWDHVHFHTPMCVLRQRFGTSFSVSLAQ